MGMGKALPAAGAQSKYMEKLATIDASKKVWIGDLNQTTTWKDLERHVQQVTGAKPGITEILPKGRACLGFKSEDDASTAIALLASTKLKGKAMQADVWTQKEKKNNTAGVMKKTNLGNKKVNTAQGKM